MCVGILPRYGWMYSMGAWEKVCACVRFKQGQKDGRRYCWWCVHWRVCGFVRARVRVNVCHTSTFLAQTEKTACMLLISGLWYAPYLHDRVTCGYKGRLTVFQDTAPTCRGARQALPHTRDSVVQSLDTTDHFQFRPLQMNKGRVVTRETIGRWVLG